VLQVAGDARVAKRVAAQRAERVRVHLAEGSRRTTRADVEWTTKQPQSRSPTGWLVPKGPYDLPHEPRHLRLRARMRIHPKSKSCSVLRSSRCSQQPPCLAADGANVAVVQPGPGISPGPAASAAASTPRHRHVQAARRHTARRAHTPGQATAQLILLLPNTSRVGGLSRLCARLWRPHDTITGSLVACPFSKKASTENGHVTTARTEKPNPRIR
jgi:hypothetical protein